MASNADIGSQVFTGTGGQPPQSSESWLSYLVTDHNRLRDLITRAEALLNAPATDVTAIQATMFELIREVSQHTAIEERNIHDLYSKYKGEEGTRWYRESLEYDARDKDSLSQLENMTWPGDLIRYREVALQFFSNTLKHMTLEETLYWPAIRQVMPADIQSGLLPKMQESRKSAPVHPHPGHQGKGGFMQRVQGFMDRVTHPHQTAGQGSAQ